MSRRRCHWVGYHPGNKSSCQLLRLGKLLIVATCAGGETATISRDTVSERGTPPTHTSRVRFCAFIMTSKALRLGEGVAGSDMAGYEGKRGAKANGGKSMSGKVYAPFCQFLEMHLFCLFRSNNRNNQCRVCISLSWWWLVAVIVVVVVVVVVIVIVRCNNPNVA
jgi:hypothetical protein